MADSMDSPEPGQQKLNLTPEEKRYYGQLFREADTDNLGVVTGDIAVKFFEKSRLEPRMLGEIWQIADSENRGFLTPAGFGLVLRLIGHVQNGGEASTELASRPGPLPKFEGHANPPGPSSGPAPPAARALQPQGSGGPIRVPPLTSEKALEYAALFERVGTSNGVLSGDQAKQIFEKANLPNEVLGRIWNLADTEQRGALGLIQFTVAMHLLASYKSGAIPAVPSTLPPGLFDAAVRRGAPRPLGGGSPQSPRAADIPPPPQQGIPRQFSGMNGPRGQSPLARSTYSPPPQTSQTTGGEWLVNPRDKAQFDGVFTSLDTANRGFITGDEAVRFFGNSRLPEEILAGIWDLADINSEGRLNKEEFAVAMYLIRQQRGTRDGRGSLPGALPPNLIPPSMRQQVRPPAQPTAPTFNNEVHATTKSASEDLFGLDAFSSPPAAPPPQTATSTGASAGAPQGLSTPPPPEQPPSSTTFKPFVPSSTFGQSLALNQSPSSPTSTRQEQPRQGPAADDLLGEADPEESKKLTSETTELGNLSNQVGTLSKQMQDVKTKRASTEQDLNQASGQKREFETRLSQLRTLYEQEVKEVKSLEDRLASSRNETSKLQQEIAMIEGTFQDLQTQHRSSAEALEADQRENANLKERMRVVNAEIGQLRPQLEKLRSDARQQKGLAAINKKQLATNEMEREKVKKDIDETSKAQEQARSGSSSQVPTPGAPGAPGAVGGVASPAASTTSQSTNPFFRRASTVTTERDPGIGSGTFSPGSASGAGSQDHNAFDSVFGPSFSPSGGSGPPPTSFRSDSGPSATGIADTSEGSSTPGISSTQVESPSEPPAPPASRQITSNLLPLRLENDRPESRSSSVKVSVPDSRYGSADYSGTATPTGGSVSAAGDSIPPGVPPGIPTSVVPSVVPGVPGASPTERTDSFKSADEEAIPGAFPGEATPAEPTPLAGPTAPAARSHDDFDEAFASFKSDKPVSEGQTPAPPADTEFPPIEEFGDDDESSDDASGKGFEDDFTSVPKGGRVTGTEGRVGSEGAEGVLGGAPVVVPEAAAAPGAPTTLRPPFTTTDTASTVGSKPPTPGAQTSPPTYDQATPATTSSGAAPGYNGLLPSREDPTSPGDGQSRSPPAEGLGPSVVAPLPHEPESTVSAVPVSSPGPTPAPASAIAPAVPAKYTPPEDDDFDFADLDDAQEGDDETDFAAPNDRSTVEEFNPTFESPRPAPSGPSPPTAPAPSGPSPAFEPRVTPGGPTAPGPNASALPEDWDSIFAGLDSKTSLPSGPNGPLGPQGGPARGVPGEGGPPPAASNTSPPAARLPASNTTPSAAPPTASNTTPSARLAPHGAASGAPAPPPLSQIGRALSHGTEHDDPILKRLTGMGYPRDDALRALERYDYHLDKAVDHLIRQSTK